MTNYYYLASDQIMGPGKGSVQFWETDSERIPGFDYPIQREIYCGVEKDWELGELLQYIHHHTYPHQVCHVQIANLVNSNRVELKVKKKDSILLHDITNPRQLLLEEGQLLTIKIVPVY